MERRRSTIPRLFLDSGVELEGLYSPWRVSRAILIHARRGASIIILAEYVRGEVEDNLLELLATNPRLATDTIDAYDMLLRLLKPEPVPLPTPKEIDQSHHLICHQADVPVLISALKASPDWLLTTNMKTAHNSDSEKG